MILEIINLVKVRRAVLYMLVLLAVLSIQEIILSHVVILGVRPMIVPIAVAAIGFWTDGVWGGVFGIIAGVLTDISLFSSSIMMTLIFPVIGFFSGALPMFFMSRRLPSFFFLSLAALVLTAFCQMFRYLVFTDTSTVALLVTAALQVLWSLPFIFVIYYPCRSFSRLKLNR